MRGVLLTVILAIYNKAAAWALDREFVQIYIAPLASFGCLWGALKSFGVHWPIFGPACVFWDALGVPLGVL